MFNFAQIAVDHQPFPMTAAQKKVYLDFVRSHLRKVYEFKPTQIDDAQPWCGVYALVDAADDVTRSDSRPRAG